MSEIRYAARSLSKSLGFTSVSVLVLSVGLGLSIFMFGAVKGYLFSSLPFPDSHELLHLERNNLERGIESMEVTQMDFLDWREQQTSFEDIAGFYTGTINISGGDRPDRYNGAFMTGNPFDILGVQPVLGRGLRPHDMTPGAPDVVVISEDIWENRYDRDPDIIGRVVRVNGLEAEIVGVMYEGFAFPLNQEIWVPLRIDPSDPEFAENRDNGQTLEVYGRLKDGVSEEQARQELNAIAARLAAEYPDTNAGVGGVVKPYEQEYFDQDLYLILYTMFAAVWLVLIIACANVANLILARSISRRRELAIRAAIGASRGRIVGSVMAEALVIAALAAVLGLIIGHWGVTAVEYYIDTSGDPEPFWVDFSVDGLTVVYAIFAAFAATILAGLLPALKAASVDPNTHLKDGTQGGGGSISRITKLLVIAEIALSCVLLVGGGLMTRSIINMSNVDLGAETSNTLVGRIGLRDQEYVDDPQAQVRFFEELERRFAAEPGVVAATASTGLPGSYPYFSGYNYEGSGLVDGEDQLPFAMYSVVLPSWFEAFDVGLLKGRSLAYSDREDSMPVVVVTQLFEQTVFPDEGAVGRRIKMDPDGEWLTIVGVVDNVHITGQDNDPLPTIFVPMAQNPVQFAFGVMRTQGDPYALSQRFRDIVLSVDPDIPTYWLQSLDDRMASENWGNKITAFLYGLFAAVAMLLSAVGIYAVLAYSVSQRTREIGVRRAMGAEDAGIVRMVARQGLTQLLIGLGIGLVLSLGFAQLLSSQLFGVSSFDPLTFVTVIVLLGSVTLAASLIPTRRALKVHPMQALRYE